MSESEHLTAILANLTAIRQYAHNGEVPRYAHIAEAKKHAEAMARDLAEADRLLAEWEEGYHAQYQKLARMTVQLAEAETLAKSRSILLDASTGALNETMEELAEAEARIATLSRYIVYSQPCQHHGSAVSRAGMQNDDPVFSGDLPDAVGEE